MAGHTPRGEPPRRSDTDLASVVRDAMTPLLLLRRQAPGVVRVDAVAQRFGDLQIGQEGCDLADCLPPDVAEPLIDGVEAVTDARGVVRVDVVDRGLGVTSLHLMPMGIGVDGQVDLVMVLGDAGATSGTDPLTGLPTRELLGDRWPLAVARARRRRDAVAILFIDLDGFKGVNDAMGHAAGDAVLAVVAERIQGCVRTGDTVARYGGDEFVLIVDGGREVVAAVADRIVESVGRSIVLADGRTATVGASVGVHLVELSGPRPELGLDAVLATADQGMYLAKAAGGGVRFI